MVDISQAALVLSHKAREARASLEPTAWVVFEQLGLEADTFEDQIVVDQSARLIGEMLGRSKDSVARALRQLADAGLVERLDERNHNSGRFIGARYVVDLAAGGLLLPGELEEPKPRRREPPRTLLNLAKQQSINARKRTQSP
jgi:DNA-binding transcriptional ArsR family regulator